MSNTATTVSDGDRLIPMVPLGGLLAGRLTLARDIEAHNAVERDAIPIGHILHGTGYRINLDQSVSPFYNGALVRMVIS
jgi:hypothetical protein